MSLVRENLLTRLGYAPYCGRGACMSRAAFNGSQFACRCGWASGFEPEFIERYKAAQAALAAGVEVLGAPPATDGPEWFDWLRATPWASEVFRMVSSKYVTDEDAKALIRKLAAHGVPEVDRG